MRFLCARVRLRHGSKETSNFSAPHPLKRGIGILLRLRGFLAPCTRLRAEFCSAINGTTSNRCLYLLARNFETKPTHTMRDGLCRYSRSRLSNCAASSAYVSGSSGSSSALRKPHDTQMKGRPAFLAVCSSTPLSPM